MINKNNLLKIVTLVCFTLFLVFLSYKALFFLGEKFYFDKLFYQKSSLFGYYKNQWEIPTHTKDQNIQKRVADLVTLLNSKPISVKNGTYTVAVIGDSFVYGQGLRQEDRLGDVLEKKLNTIRPTKVISLAISGDSYLDNYAKLKLLQKQQKIDLFVIAVVDNDLLFNYHNKYPGEEELFSQISSACLGTEFTSKSLPNILPDTATSEQIAYLNAVSFAPEYTNSCYAKEIGKALDMPNLIYIILTSPKDISAPNPETAPQLSARFIQLLPNNSKVLEPYKKEKFAYTPISKIETHPSATTHLFYANLLFQEINQQAVYSFNPKLK